MCVLQQSPGIGQQPPEAGHFIPAVRQNAVSHGVLHPGVGHDDEEPRDPRSQKDHHRREPVHDLGEPVLAVEKQPEEGRLQEETEDALHGQRLANDAAGKLRKARPVGTELELHGNAGHNAEDKIDGEEAAPEPRRPIPRFVVGPESHRLQHYDQQRQPHGELREEIVVSDSEGKLQAMNQLTGHGASPGTARVQDNTYTAPSLRTGN